MRSRGPGQTLLSLYVASGALHGRHAVQNEALKPRLWVLVCVSAHRMLNTSRNCPETGRVHRPPNSQGDIPCSPPPAIAQKGGGCKPPPTPRGTPLPPPRRSEAPGHLTRMSRRHLGSCASGRLKAKLNSTSA